MFDSFHIAATGLHAQEANVDTIANNLANWNTTGYKKGRVDFEDLMYRQLSTATGLIGNPDLRNPAGVGSAVSSIGKIFSQGDLKTTGRDLDVAIQGDGFFELLLPDGRYAYTRAGVFQINEDGLLVNADGFQLSPLIQLPSDTQQVIIQPDGDVLAAVPDQANPINLDRIVLASFVNPGGLTPTGDNLYVPSHKSGDVFYGDPGEEGFGQLGQGFLEGSNVDESEEITNLVLAQRGYEVNARVIQTADQMMAIVNELARSAR
jgi:flagellar basal-body rod protein FlgG